MNSLLDPYALEKMSILALSLKSLVQQPFKIFLTQTGSGNGHFGLLY